MYDISSRGSDPVKYKSDLAGWTVRLEIRHTSDRHTKESEVSGVSIILVVLGRSFLVAAA